MSYQRILIGTLVAVIACVSSEELQACEVALQVKNTTTFTVVEVKYRKHESNSWSTIISNPNQIEPNNSKVIHWNGDGDYEIAIRSSNAPSNPVSITTPNICAMSQIIVSNTGVKIR
jgi:hypothetical protein